MIHQFVEWAHTLATYMLVECFNSIMKRGRKLCSYSSWDWDLSQSLNAAARGGALVLMSAAQLDTRCTKYDMLLSGSLQHDTPGLIPPPPTSPARKVKYMDADSYLRNAISALPGARMSVKHSFQC